ncbi:hypothetical protein GCM10010254_68300 [Streptomyces chromofuscus]|nr:hypothetical protein GCM10010254_68300 [Streptomyces chromofuscus]
MNDPLIPIVSAYTAVRCTMSDALEAGRFRRNPDGTVLAVSGAPVATLNGVISPHLEPRAETIEALADCADLADLPWSIQVRGVPSPSVAQVAAQHGLTVATTLPLMVRPREAEMPALPDAGPLRVRAVEAGELDAYARLMEEGFGVSEGTFKAFTEPGVAKEEGFTHYVAEIHGTPVGTGMAAISEDLLGVFNISVVPQHRRRGYGLAVTMEMVRAGYAAGATTAYLYSSPMGQSVYASAGFRLEEVLTAYTAPPSHDATTP